MSRNKSVFDYIIETPLFVLLALILVGAPLWLGAVDQDAFAWMVGLCSLMLGWHAVLLAFRPSSRQLWLPPNFTVLIFAVFVVWRYFTADIEFVARMEMLRVLCYAGIFLVVVQQLHKQGWIYSILSALIIVGTGLAIMAIIQYITDSRMVWNQKVPSQYWGRGSGSYICPNHLGGLLEMIIPIAMAMGLSSRISHSLRIGLIYCALVMLAGLAVTFSRGAWFSIVVSITILLMIFFRRPHLRWATLAVVILLTGGVAFFMKSSSDAGQRIVEVRNVDGEIENIRFVIWKAGLEMWKKQPILGTGPGHFDHRFQEFRPESFQHRAGYAHNDYLNTLTDYGIVGLILVLLTPGILLVNFKGIWKGNRRDQTSIGEKNSNKEPVLIGCSLGLLAIMIHSIVDFNMQIPANAAVMTVLLAIVTSHWRNSTRKFWISPKWWMSALQIPVFILMGIFLGIQAWVLWKSYQVGRTASPGIAKSGSDQKKALELAHTIDPKNFKFSGELAEFHRRNFFEGNDGYKESGENAMKWYSTAIQSNPWNHNFYIGLGGVLDGFYRESEADKYFAKALELDPNGYFTLAQAGYHAFMKQDYNTALDFMERSQAIKPVDNKIVEDYLDLVKYRMENP